VASEGSVYRRATDGRWVAAWHDVHGRRRYAYRPTRNAARQALREALRDRDEGAGGDNPRLGDYAGRWVANLEARETTLADYRYKLSLLPDWLMRKRLRELTADDIREMIRELRATPTKHGKPRAVSTVAQVRTVLGNVLAQAEADRLITWNPARAVPAPKTEHTEIVPLTLDEAAALFAVTAQHRLGSLYLVAGTVGMRLGECLGLTWADVDLEQRRLQVVRQITWTNEGVRVEGDPKTKRSRRTVVLPDVCADALVIHRRRQAAERLAAGRWYDRDLVWPSQVGSPLMPGNVRRHLRHAAAEAGLVRPITFHTLRHSSATLLLAQGVEARVIADVLGWGDLRMAMRYAHVTDGLRKDAAAAIDQARKGAP
jgi:integrase